MNSKNVVNPRSDEVALVIKRGVVQHLLPEVRRAVRSARAQVGHFRNQYNSNPARAAKAEARRDALLPILERLEAVNLEPWAILREEDASAA